MTNPQLSKEDIVLVCLDDGLGGHLPKEHLAIEITQAISHVDSLPLLRCSFKQSARTDDTNTKLIDSLKATGRSKVVLYGSLLEGGINHAALACLAEGFDVHILIDAVQCAIPKHRGVVCDRLRQHGVMILTRIGFLLEITLSDPVEPFRTLIVNLLAAETAQTQN